MSKSGRVMFNLPKANRHSTGVDKTRLGDRQSVDSFTSKPVRTRSALANKSTSKKDSFLSGKSPKNCSDSNIRKEINQKFANFRKKRSSDLSKSPRKLSSSNDNKQRSVNKASRFFKPIPDLFEILKKFIDESSTNNTFFTNYQEEKLAKLINDAMDEKEKAELLIKNINRFIDCAKNSYYLLQNIQEISNHGKSYEKIGYNTIPTMPIEYNIYNKDT